MIRNYACAVFLRTIGRLIKNGFLSYNVLFYDKQSKGRSLSFKKRNEKAGVGGEAEKIKTVFDEGRSLVLHAQIRDGKIIKTRIIERPLLSSAQRQ